TTHNTIFIPKKDDSFHNFDEACVFVEAYTTQTNIVVILAKTTKNPDNSDYRQNELGIIENLHDNELQIKDIYTILDSSSELTEVQGLNEIEMLLRTLQNNESIISSIATKPAYNNKHD
ncbi:15220_t:CDS:2, partial [Racocetra persica]